MIPVILGMLLGCLAICHLTQLPSFLQLSIFSLSGISLAAIFYCHSKLRSIGLILLGLILGSCWTSFNGYLYLQHQLPKQLEDKILTVTGTVLSLPAEKSENISFLFKIKKIDQVIPSE